MFSSLPEFVRGCDHVVKFFQSEKRIRRKSDNKKNKSVAKTEEQSNCKNKQNEFESPHNIAEAVREQSLGRKDKVKSADVTSTKIKKKTNSESSAENVSKNNDTCIVGRESLVDIDENGNEVKSILCGKLWRPDFLICDCHNSTTLLDQSSLLFKHIPQLVLVVSLTLS